MCYWLTVFRSQYVFPLSLSFCLILFWPTESTKHQLFNLPEPIETFPSPLAFFMFFSSTTCWTSPQSRCYGRPHVLLAPRLPLTVRTSHTHTLSLSAPLPSTLACLYLSPPLPCLCIFLFHEHMLHTASVFRLPTLAPCVLLSFSNPLLLSLSDTHTHTHKHKHTNKATHSFKPEHIPQHPLTLVAHSEHAVATPAHAHTSAHTHIHTLTHAHTHTGRRALTCTHGERWTQRKKGTRTHTRTKPHLHLQFQA